MGKIADKMKHVSHIVNEQNAEVLAGEPTLGENISGVNWATWWQAAG